MWGGIVSPRESGPQIPGAPLPTRKPVNFAVSKTGNDRLIERVTLQLLDRPPIERVTLRSISVYSESSPDMSMSGCVKDMTGYRYGYSATKIILHHKFIKYSSICVTKLTADRISCVPEPSN